MREIIFRGKRICDGKWIYGDLRQWTKKSKGICEYEIGKTSRVLVETVGQYTGLTDKKGKKIFEKDIVRYGDTIHKVVFEQRNGTAYFGLVYSEIETLPFGHDQNLRQIEVIGNIHDNPKLLEFE